MCNILAEGMHSFTILSLPPPPLIIQIFREWINSFNRCITTSVDVLSTSNQSAQVVPKDRSCWSPFANTYRLDGDKYIVLSTLQGPRGGGGHLRPLKPFKIKPEGKACKNIHNPCE